MKERTDSERLDWLSEKASRLQDVYWRVENEDCTVREAIDWLWKRQEALGLKEE